jgi:hypothetical protein
MAKPKKKKLGKTECEVRKMSLVELQPASYNPRKMTVEAYQGLGKSIEKFGLLVPIVWNKRSGNVVGGHQRLRYLQETGETETDVMVVDLDDNEEVALNISLNNHAIRGDFTSDVVALLEKTEVQMGSSFNEVLLSDLFKDMEKQFEKELKAKLKTQEPFQQPSGNPPPAPPSGPPVPQKSAEQDTVITCPECKSRWRMSNNEVLFDSRTAT